MLALTAATILANAAGCGDLHSGQPLYLGQPLVRNGTLATMRAYPANTADCVHRDGFNGRIWNSRPINGPGCDHASFAWPAPGPAAYGAHGCDDAVVFGIVNHTLVSFSPWIKFHGETMKGYEAVRRQWLRENGFTGGVRTFVNDNPMPSEEAGKQTGLPEPRAIIELAPDAPRAKSRLRVEAGPSLPMMKVRTSEGKAVAMKVSKPGQGSRIATITSDSIKKVSKPTLAIGGTGKMQIKSGRVSIPSQLAAR